MFSKGMTELKSLSEPEGKPALVDEAAIFLNPGVEKRFMSRFEIGSNKMTLYGMPLIMAKHSELIKTQLAIYAGSEEPYPLLTHGVILENAVIPLWLHMNGKTFSYNDLETMVNALSVTEMFQLYRLLGYFGVYDDNFSSHIRTSLRNKIWMSSEKDKKEIEDNKDTVIKFFNSLLSSSPIYYGGNWYADMNEKFPAIMKELNVIPIIIINSETPKGYTIALSKKEVLENKDLFTEIMKPRNLLLNSDGSYSNPSGRAYLRYYITKWGPDKIILTEQTLLL
jgi:hypothetical protein